MKNLRRTTFVTILCIVTMCGLGFSRVGGRLDLSWFVLSLACTVTIYFITKKSKSKTALYLFAILTMFLLGWLRGSSAMKQLRVYDFLDDRQIMVEAIALEDSVYSERGQLTFVVGNMFVLEPVRTELIGELDIEGFGEPIIYRGDKVQLSGQLYKKRGGQQGGISFANIKLVERNPSWINDLRRDFAAGMQNTLPEPLASFGLGLLIGQRNTLSEELNQQLIAVGLIHIVAVSGYNLTVIIHMSQKLFARRSRYQSLILSLVLIGLFLLLTGYSPSIVRAAIVSTLSLVAWYFGRKFKPVLLLSLVASLTAFVNPLYPWSNIGWYLSFTAFFGILVLAPLLNKRFLSKKRQDKILPTVIIETFSAQLLTLPIILFIFGRLSVVSIIANMLVVPIVPLGMLFSLFAGIAGMINFVFAGLVAIPAKIVLGYMLSISSLLSKLPYANVIFNINLAQMLTMYALILSSIVLLYAKVKKRHVTITE